MRYTRRQFIAAAAIGLALPPMTFGQQPSLEKIDLFEAGKDGYKLYRIPGLVVTKSGALLAYCEARKTGKGDWDTIDIMLQRSMDNGRTWDGPRRIADVEGPKSKNPVALERKQANPDDVTYNNPVAIADHRTGTVHFLFCLEYARCFYMRSDDDGATFTKPVEITSTFEGFRARYDWRVIATGPAHGIQLKNGRLIVPVWLSLGTEGNGHGPSVTSVIYSDDHGKTWRAGEIIGLDTPDFINPNETVAAQLADGRVLFNMRSVSKANRRAISFSRDGATGWSKAVFDRQLAEPICMASIARLSEKPNGDRNRIIFANPDNLARADGRDTPGLGRDRKNLTIKLSYDEAQTWPISKTLEPGPSAYSDLAVGRDGTIFCFYEAAGADGKLSNSGRLTLARFNLEWLTDGRDRLKPKK
ncbi:MAG TPA: sialidase family protein [Blastocatellia bacterium]|nr:sialidase family protein [Blastocatellia bacterium]